MNNPVSLVGILAFATLLPFVLAAGSCFIKFSVVFSLLRNAIGLQQVPSNLAMQGLALIMTGFVMMPVADQATRYLREHAVRFDDAASTQAFLDQGLGAYRDYLARYADPSLVNYFAQLQARRDMPDDAPPPVAGANTDPQQASLFVLLPAYALSELKSAFRIGFYLYLPFLVVDMLVSNILLALGMMMMSPITIALPIKLILFVALDGWSEVTRGLLSQYLPLTH